MFSPSDTIVAIATPPGRGGVGVVRISGPDARLVGARILTAKAALAPRVATFTRVAVADGAAATTEAADIDSDSTGAAPRAIDQVIATFFPGPASYTGDDVLEVSAHGSPVVLEGVVRAALSAGARLAEPGEFTLRAFLNGRIDLVQAEAVADLVDAVTPLQARAAFDQLEGTLTTAIARSDAALFDLVARLEASIDFPDEGYHFAEPSEIERELRGVGEDIENLAREGRTGRIVREGRQVVIAGKPNVGKSTLFNRLVGTERAIVTRVAGTTRDLVTETVEVGGIRACLVDTAGVREAGDEVESEGVRRAMAAAGIADLVIVVLDRSRPIDRDDLRLLEATGRADRVIVANKCDLAARWELGAVEEAAGQPAIAVSLATGDNVTVLKQALADRLLGGERLRDVPAVTNVRHIALLAKAAEAIRRGLAALGESGGRLPEELLLADLQDARSALEEITGRRTTDDLLAHIFERFCVGK